MTATGRLDDDLLIAQFSDIHCGDPRFDEALMRTVLEEVNAAKPDIVIVPGDLTAFGYAEQYREAKGYLDSVECRNLIVIAGNHDCRNVGETFFEGLIGARHHVVELPIEGAGEATTVKVVAIDSNKPDLDDGEIGRDTMRQAKAQLSDPANFNVFVLHHHLVSIPGTGRERNIVWDAGDVLHGLRDIPVDLVLAGHKHVPYAWPLAGMLIVTSGTASTWRTRGEIPPSYNLIRVTPDEIRVTVRYTTEGTTVEQDFPRRGMQRTAR